MDNRITPSGCRFLVVVAFVALRHQDVAAQVPSLRLGSPTATFQEEFTQIASLRELGDGSVLVADPTEKVLKHLDPSTARAEAIGRAGQGPLEYERLGEGLNALRGDTTLLDEGNGTRWIYLVGARMLGTGGPSVERRLAAGSVIGADTLGRVLTQRSIQPPINPNGGLTVTPLSDSAMFILSAAGLEHADTVARVQVGGDPFPLTSGTLARLFPDGWLAIAYPEPYHVEWRRPDGSRVRGATLPVSRVPVDAAQRAFTLTQTSPQLARVMSTIKDPSAWPALLPAFVRRGDRNLNAAANTVQAAPDGRLLILRTPDARTPTTVRYDVIDRTGALAASLTIAANQRIVGTGLHSVYVAETDADDIQRLSRYAWPPQS